MIGKTRAHETSTSVVGAAPGEVGASTAIALKVRVSCSSSCDLRGKTVNIVAQDAVVVKQVELVAFAGTVNETAEFVVKAPVEPGEHTWTAVFPAQEKEGVLHEASTAPFALVVKPHVTSIALWDVPSPNVLGEEFKIKVGVKCSAGCKLTGKKISIYDHDGAQVATGALGDAPWPGTDALYWVDVEVEAPAVEGTYTWTARFAEPGLEVSHEEASYAFAFRTGRRPEHVVTVEVTEEDTKTLLKDAHVLLHPYSGQTNDDGMARLEVPKGTYRLYVTKNEYQVFQTTVEVADDVAVSVGLAVIPHDWNEQG